MKTLKNIEAYIDRILTKWSLNYIEKVSKTLYPKPHLTEEVKEKNNAVIHTILTENKTVDEDEKGEKDEDEPILFI